MSKIVRIRPLLAGLVLALIVAVAGGAPATGASPSKTGDESNTPPIDLNSATAEELKSVPGIGEVMAQRIVDFREQHGPFSRVDDLLKVKGIGEKSLEKLRRYFKVSGEG